MRKDAMWIRGGRQDPKGRQKELWGRGIMGGVIEAQPKGKRREGKNPQRSECGV